MSNESTRLSNEPHIEACPLDAEISFFNGTFTPVPSKNVSISSILDDIKIGIYKTEITRVRQVLKDDKDEYRRLKTNILKAVSFSGTFQKRSNSNLLKHSGIILADIDHLSKNEVESIKSKVFEDPHTAFIFTSPSNEGLKVGCQFKGDIPDDETHKRCFELIRTYFKGKFNIVIDKTTDCSRLCYVSHDPGLMRKITAEKPWPIPPVPVKLPPPVRQKRVYTNDGFDNRAQHGQRAVNTAIDMILGSSPGGLHFARFRAARLLGGFIPEGMITYQEAYNALETAVQQNTKRFESSMKTIRDGLAYGQSSPFSYEEKEAQRQAYCDRYRVSAKTSYRTPQKKYNKMDLIRHIENLEGLETGKNNIKVAPVLPGGGCWTVIRLKADQDIKKNIESAHVLMAWMADHDLLSGLKVILSGKSFIFAAPWIIPPDYKKTWLSFLQDRRHNIDASRQTGKNQYSPMDILGYDKRRNRHTHVIDDIGTLKPGTYQELVNGPVLKKQLIEWAMNIIPSQTCPLPWFDMLNSYKSIGRIIRKLNFPNSKTVKTEGFKDKAECREELYYYSLNEKKDVLLIYTPGSGKSYALMKACIDIVKSMGLLKNRIIILTVPTNEKALEVVDEFRDMANEQGVKLTRIQGRNKDNCKKYSQVKKALSRGFSPKKIVCDNCKLYRKKQCEYINQEKPYTPGIYVACHAKLPFIDCENVGVIGLDEDPIKAFCIIRDVCFDNAMYPLRRDNGALFGNVYSDIDKAFSEKIEIVKGLMKKNETGRLYATEPVGKWTGDKTIWDLCGIGEDQKNRMAEIFRQQYEKPYLESFSTWQKKLWNNEKINMNAVEWWGVALGSKEGSAWIDHNGKKIVFKFSKKQKPVGFTGRYIAIDATGNKTDLEACLDREFVEYTGNIAIDADTVWIRNNGGSCKTRMLKFSDTQLEKKVKLIKQFIPDHAADVMPCTFMKIKNQVERIAKRTMPESKVESIHFFGSRGVNRFGNFDAGFILGTPNINPSGAEAIGAVLYPDNIDKINDYIDRQGISETIQAGHRIRLINRLKNGKNGKKTFVVMAKHFPFGDPDIIYDPRHGVSDQIDESYRRVKLFMDEFGFMTRLTGFMLGFCCFRENWKDVQKIHRHSSILQHLSRFNEVSLIYNTQSSIKKTPNFLNSLTSLNRETCCNALILHEDNRYLFKIFDKIRVNYPDSRPFEIQNTSSGKWSKGIGDRKKAKEFFNMMGAGDLFKFRKKKKAEPVGSRTAF